MRKLLSAIAVVLALLLVTVVSHMANAADPKTGKGQGGPGNMGPGNQPGNPGAQKKDLTEDDARQMIKDLNELKKMHQEFRRKMMEFQQKYGMTPDLGMGMGPGGQGGGQGGNMGPGGNMPPPGGENQPGGKKNKFPDDGANADFPQPNF
ncbi:MAG: hypothetical protein A2X45_06845 [Lentisphaerae bacterium GWF2_50_93]|nr:MAG: hypothetical protein A2X45_06845 [Lentisphaerae bacterium GWF2_50_93]